MGTLNVASRTLAVMDNYPFLRALNNECVDLIAIDPPFAANETFTNQPKPPINQAEFDEEVALAAAHGVAHNEGIGETRVKDYWNWDDDIHPEWKMRIQDDYPRVHSVIEAVEACATENEAAYICFMAVRLIECWRVLKPTGSIYIHCDNHANSYLRMLLDAILGADNFRSEITWKRSSAHSDTRQGRRQHGRIHDRLLFYTRSDKWTWNPVYTEYDPGYVASNYKHIEPETGRIYRLDNLTGPGGAAKGNPSYEVMGVTRYWRYSQKRMQELIDEGRIVQTSPGAVPSYKRYLDEMPGVPLQDLWTDINPIQSQSSERTGYATQKPIALYERIIESSSNPGDVVLDIFAGCATTAVAAEGLGRQWIACDMAYRAWTMLKRRFYLNGIALDGMTDSTRNALAAVKKDKGFQEPQQWTSSDVIGPGELPKRDDVDPVPGDALTPTLSLRERGFKGKQSTQSATWSGQISKEDAKELLIQRFGPVCWGCGYEPRRPNGSLDGTLLEVDHIRARKASEGVDGDDELYNLALLHRTCNGVKRNKLTLEELRRHNADNGLLYVNTVGELVDLFEATRFAAQEIGRRMAEGVN